MMKEILPQLVQALIPLVIAIASWALYAASNWLQAHAKTEYQRGVLARLTEAVSTIVSETQQTTVEALKAAAADGKITAEEAAELKDGAISRVRGYLGKRGLKELETVFDRDMIDKVIASKIEAEIAQMKLFSPAPDDAKGPGVVVVADPSKA